MACENDRATVVSLQNKLWALKAELAAIGELQGSIFAKPIIEKISQTATSLTNAENTLESCLLVPRPDRPPGLAPQSLLQISFANPQLPSTIDIARPDWTSAFVGPSSAGGSNNAFPLGAEAEWMPVIDPGQQWDVHPVGASGWVFGLDFSRDDVPFTHPFGRDWEFYFAVDASARANAPPRGSTSGSAGQGKADPASKAKSADLSIAGVGLNATPDYSWLVAPANKINTAPAAAASLEGVTIAPNGLLGVEMERGLLPDDFVSHVREGDRIAVFGRWIVDAGHYYPGVTPGSPDLAYRTEIHPPLLMACAGLRTVAGRTVARTVITSRPYLASQKFINGTDKINDDNAPDDGYMVAHLHNEITKVVEFESNSIEAHPKVMSKPFIGRHEFTITLRPPPRRVSGIVTSTLSISYHFTVRGQCKAQLTSDGESVELQLTLDDANYPLTGLPTRHERVYNKANLTALNPDVGPAYADAETAAEKGDLLFAGLATAVFGLAGGVLGAISELRVRDILDAGVTTDEYPGLEQTTILTGWVNPVLNISPAQLTNGGGHSRDDLQPFPLHGWVELEWVEPTQQGAQQQASNQELATR